MEIWNSLEQVPQELRPTVVTIGIFDGVHKGHREIIRKTCQQAQERNLKAVALTFHPHPVKVHNPKTHLRMICSLEDRLLALESLGIDATLVQKYDLDFAALSPKEFVKEFLVDALKAKVIVVGEDMRFGARNAADVNTLKQLGKELGFDVQSVTDRVDNHGKRWSSTWVRTELENGRVEEAARILGRPHRVRGLVVHGVKRGRKLGFPTANLDACQVDEVPADGVYAGWLQRTVHSPTGAVSVEILPAAISVGTNPTFEYSRRTVEAHVLGRCDLDLYGEQVVVEFISRLRPMERFDSLEELLAHMDQDLLRASKVLEVPKAYRVDPELVQAGLDHTIGEGNKLQGQDLV